VPLIEICALPQPTGVEIEPVLQAVTAAVSDAIPCRREAVWATWRSIDGGYAMGESVANEQPRDSHAVIVHVYANRPPDAIERLSGAIEEVLTGALSLEPGNVFVTVQPVFNAPG
jgi:hypothetical protein